MMLRRTFRNPFWKMEKKKLVPISEAVFSDGTFLKNQESSRIPDADRIAATFSEETRKEASFFFGVLEANLRNDKGHDGGFMAESETLKNLRNVDFSTEFLAELVDAFLPNSKTGRLAVKFGYVPSLVDEFPFTHQNLSRERALGHFENFVWANRYGQKTFIENWGDDAEIVNAAFSKVASNLAKDSLRGYGIENESSFAFRLIGAPAFSGNRIEAYEDLVIIGKDSAVSVLLSMEGIPGEIVEFCVGLGYGKLAVKHPLSEKSRTSILKRLLDSNSERQDVPALKDLLSNPCLSSDDVASVVNACVYRNPRLGKDFLELAVKHPQFRRDSLSTVVSEASKSLDATFAKECVMAACLSPMLSQEDVDVLGKSACRTAVSSVLYAYRPSLEARGIKVPRIFVPKA